MKKKLLALGLIAALSSSILVGCGGDTKSDSVSTESAQENMMTTSETTTKDKKEITLEDLELKEYKYSNSYSTEYLVAVKNNSQLTIQIGANDTAYDLSNNMVGASSSDIYVIGPGEESCMLFYFSSSDVDHVEYKDTLQYKINPYNFIPVLSNLKVQEAVNDESLILAVTNDGNISARSVEAYAVFMDEENTSLAISSGFVGDSDLEVKPGATQSGEIDYFESYEKGDFDHVVWYLSSYGTAF